MSGRGFAEFTEGDLRELSDEALLAVAQDVLAFSDEDRRENALRYYTPWGSNRPIHFSPARVLLISGGNGCLPLGEPVLMADGSWKALREIRVGDRVIGVDPETRQAIPTSVVRTYRSGFNPVYRVTFSDGGSVRATGSHRIPMLLGAGRWTSKRNAKRPRKRELRGYLDRINDYATRNPSKRVSFLSPGDIQWEGDSKIGLPPYLLGALLGDGSFTGGSTVKFHNVDQAIIARVRRHAETLDCELVKYRHGCEFGLRSAVPGTNRISWWIEQLGLQGVKDVDKFIPDEAMRLGRTDRLELLAGLIDTDGTRDWFVSASHRLAEGVVRLVRSLGGKATIHERESPHGKAWGVYVRLNERIPLSRPEKQAPNQPREIDYARRVCRSVECVGVFETGDIEVEHPGHCYVAGDWVVVSNSSKTESALAEILMCGSGIVPDSLREPDGSIPSAIRDKLIGPRRQRVVVESLTNTLPTIILEKFQWWRWTGLLPVGGDKGHWGWIPRNALINGDWEKSWSAKHRTLRYYYRDPDSGKVLGESLIQFMSHDNEPTDFASGDFHDIVLDEPPSEPIFKECQARTMRVAGRIILAMTWPDDPSIPVDWIHDKVYDPAQRGDKGFEWINLYTTDNPHLDQVAIRAQMDDWDDETVRVRIKGESIRFSNRIHPLFTDQDAWWCFRCGKTTSTTDNGTCTKCQSANVIVFNHVTEFDPGNGPCVWLLDPHPRKPHMYCWVQPNAQDDWYVVAEGLCEGDPTDVVEDCARIESELGIHTGMRLMDPNMGASPSSAKRERTWQTEFDDVGMLCDLADDSMTGRKGVNTWLKPDKATCAPRLFVHPRCATMIYQMKRYTWSDYKRGTAADRDQKQKPRDKDDDFPTLLKYLANSGITYGLLALGAPVISRRGNRR